MLNPALEKTHPEYVHGTLFLEKLLSTRKQAKIHPSISLYRHISITPRHTVRDSLIIEAIGHIQNAHDQYASGISR